MGQLLGWGMRMSLREEPANEVENLPAQGQ